VLIFAKFAPRGQRAVRWNPKKLQYFLKPQVKRGNKRFFCGFFVRGSARLASEFRHGIQSLNRSDFRVRLDFRVREEGVMDENFETTDLSEFIDSCAKQFCPWCGMPMGRNPMGRPRVFCSDRCRWAYNSWRHRKRMKEKENGNTNLKEHTGEGSETGSIQPEKETETGR
jgi:endogenous inhibitor of DNA gyrase (YacG/DUF329 family)